MSRPALGRNFTCSSGLLDLEGDAAVGIVNTTKLFLIYLILLTVQLNYLQIIFRTQNPT